MLPITLPLAKMAKRLFLPNCLSFVSWTCAQGRDAIACSIASEYPAAHVVALDIAPEALALASKNVGVLGLGNRVEVLESDLLDALDPSKKGALTLLSRIRRMCPQKCATAFLAR